MSARAQSYIYNILIMIIFADYTAQNTARRADRLRHLDMCTRVATYFYFTDTDQ